MKRIYIETKAHTDKNSNIKKKLYLHSHWMQDIHILLLHIVE